MSPAYASRDVASTKLSCTIAQPSIGHAKIREVVRRFGYVYMFSLRRSVSFGFVGGWSGGCGRPLRNAALDRNDLHGPDAFRKQCSSLEGAERVIRADIGAFREMVREQVRTERDRIM